MLNSTPSRSHFRSVMRFQFLAMAQSKTDEAHTLHESMLAPHSLNQNHLSKMRQSQAAIQPQSHRSGVRLLPRSEGSTYCTYCACASTSPSQHLLNFIMTTKKVYDGLKPWHHSAPTQTQWLQILTFRQNRNASVTSWTSTFTRNMFPLIRTII